MHIFRDAFFFTLVFKFTTSLFFLKQKKLYTANQQPFFAINHQTMHKRAKFLYPLFETPNIHHQCKCKCLRSTTATAKSKVNNYVGIRKICHKKFTHSHIYTQKKAKKKNSPHVLDIQNKSGAKKQIYLSIPFLLRASLRVLGAFCCASNCVLSVETHHL